MTALKKTIFLLVCLTSAFSAFAQAQIQTKSYKVSDFREKTMKVITTGDALLDASLKDAIQKIWHISSYEFCTMAQFEKVKKLQDFYFLMVTDVKFKNDKAAGLKSLTLYKGGDKAGENVQGLLEILSMPVCRIENFSSMESAFMSAFVNIFQSRLEQLLTVKMLASSSVKSDPKFSTKTNQDIYFPESALAFAISDSNKAAYEKAGIHICSDAVAEKIMKTSSEDAVVGFALIPDDTKASSVSYLYLVSALDWKLCKVSKRSVSDKNPAGFTAKDINDFYYHRER